MERKKWIMLETGFIKPNNQGLESHFIYKELGAVMLNIHALNSRVKAAEVLSLTHGNRIG